MLTRAAQQTEADRLKARAQELRIQFANADLDMAMTFLRLARTALETGGPEHATELLAKAQRAADTVAEIVQKLPHGSADDLWNKLATLVAAIAKAKRTGQ